MTVSGAHPGLAEAHSLQRPRSGLHSTLTSLPGDRGSGRSQDSVLCAPSYASHSVLAAETLPQERFQGTTP